MTTSRIKRHAIMNSIYPYNTNYWTNNVGDITFTTVCEDATAADIMTEAPSTSITDAYTNVTFLVRTIISTKIIRVKNTLWLSSTLLQSNNLSIDEQYYSLTRTSNRFLNIYHTLLTQHEKKESIYFPSFGGKIKHPRSVRCYGFSKISFNASSKSTNKRCYHLLWGQQHDRT